MPRSEIRLTQITAWITIAALVTVVMLNNNLINVLIKFYNNIYTRKATKKINEFISGRALAENREGYRGQFTLVMGVCCCWRGGLGLLRLVDSVHSPMTRFGYQGEDNQQNKPQ